MRELLPSSLGIGAGDPEHDHPSVAGSLGRQPTLESHAFANGYDDPVNDAGEDFKQLLGVREDSVESGTVTLVLQAADKHLNEAGSVHGGVLASLVDMAMGSAVRSLSEDGEVPATSQLTVTYLRPGKPGRLEVTARVRKQGEHLTVCEAEIEQQGRPLVHALATFAVLAA